MTDQEINTAVSRKLNDDWTVACHHTPMCVPPPDYCHSMAEAWKILDRFAVFSLKKYDAIYECNLYGKDCESSGSSYTAPRAICEAFLTASGFGS